MFAASRTGARARAFTILLAAAAAGCASGSRRQPADNAYNAPIRIEIDNNAVLDMNIYALPDAGGRFRIGFVSAKRSETFSVRMSRLGSTTFRLVGDPVGSAETRVSDIMPVAAGITAVWQIGHTEAISWSQYYYR